MKPAIVLAAVAGLLGYLAWPRQPQSRGATMTNPHNRADPEQIGIPIFSTRLLSRRQIEAANIIVQHAVDADINAAFMLALAVTESSLNPAAIGDDGLSVGLFQLNKKFIAASEQELLDADFNADAAMVKMNLLFRSFPGFTYGDYAEAWTLGGAGRFKKMRRLPAKLVNMDRAINDLSLDLSLSQQVG